MAALSEVRPSSIIHQVHSSTAPRPRSPWLSPHRPRRVDGAVVIRAGTDRPLPAPCMYVQFSFFVSFPCCSLAPSTPRRQRQLIGALHLRPTFRVEGIGLDTLHGCPPVTHRRVRARLCYTQHVVCLGDGVRSSRTCLLVLRPYVTQWTNARCKARGPHVVRRAIGAYQVTSHHTPAKCPEPHPRVPVEAVKMHVGAFLSTSLPSQRLADDRGCSWASA